MEKRVSLADIARQTGFTVPTVSKALRHVGTMPLHTRRKIQRQARALKYRPNPLLAALASKHFSADQASGTPLAYLHVQALGASEEAVERKMMMEGQEHGRRLGYRLELFNITDFRNGEHATRVLFARGIQGILLSQRFRLTMLPGMDWERFCVVGWGEHASGPAHSKFLLPHRVAVDHFELVMTAWNETWARGYRRIGFALFSPISTYVDDELRWGAAQACLQRVPARDRLQPLIYTTVPTDGPPANSRAVGAWVRRQKPDAVIALNGFIHWALLDQGFRIPRDVGFVSLHKETLFDRHETLAPREAGMVHVRQPSVFAGLELLDQQIRFHQYGLPREARTITIHSRWMDGATLPTRKSPAARRTAGSRVEQTLR